MKTDMFKTFALTAFALVFTGSLLAQQAPDVPPPCSNVVPGILKNLQSQADQNCTTQTACVACVEEKSGAVVYMTLMAHPQTPVCKIVQEISNTKVSADRVPASNTAVGRPGEPVFEVMQTPCPSGSGAKLSIYMPGNQLVCAQTDYTYKWEVDGVAKGKQSSSSLDCVCGNKATVTVTDRKTGKSTTKRLELIVCKD